MMMSLFSMFDPSALFNLPMNWMMMTVTLILLPTNFWNKKSRFITVIFLILFYLNKEFSSLFKKNFIFKGITLMPISLFMIIMMNNLSSNLPYTFCCSAHLNFSLSLAVPMWITIILFSWMNLTNKMFAHLLPTGTPTMLMPVMIMIELTSNFIRPMALAIRLSANMIAGHLLMALLGNNFNLNYSLIMISIIQSLFMTFELMVALIQSYVFSVLTTLYSSEC